LSEFSRLTQSCTSSSSGRKRFSLSSCSESIYGGVKLTIVNVLASEGCSRVLHAVEQVEIAGFRSSSE
jgi:hypothetical protein